MGHGPGKGTPYKTHAIGSLENQEMWAFRQKLEVWGKRAGCGLRENARISGRGQVTGGNARGLQIGLQEALLREGGKQSCRLEPEFLEEVKSNWE